MRFPALNKLILTLLVLPHVTSGQQQVACSGTSAFSTDGAYQACWLDLPIAANTQARRLIFVVDTASNELLFAHSTFQRHTGAVWNTRSTACALFDSPDNANVYLWVIRKSGSKSSAKWNVQKIDVERLAAEKMKAPPRDNPRLGLEKLEWETDELLVVHLIFNGTKIDLEIRATN